jgi:hypothetical protein
MKHKELAEQAGFEISSSNFANLGLVWCSDEYPIDEQLERFAELVRADEREVCAKLCESRYKAVDFDDFNCADEIRARGEK